MTCIFQRFFFCGNSNKLQFCTMTIFCYFVIKEELFAKNKIFDLHQKFLRCGITVLPKVPHDVAQDFFLGRTVFMAPGQLCKN